MQKKLVKFALVGGVGFIIDAATLALLSTVMPVVAARGAAFWVAASSTWWCNRVFTFNDGQYREPIGQWGRFMLCAMLGFVPNWGCYWLLFQGGDPHWLRAEFGQLGLISWPYIAMIPGILLGMLVNFSLSQRWVFTKAVG